MNSTDPVWTLIQALPFQSGLTVHSLGKLMKENGLVLLLAETDRGDGRMAHYGNGKQPWDDCLEEGWAHYGAAFSILRYLRRSKQPERDLQAAKVYYGWLRDLAKQEKSHWIPIPINLQGSIIVFRKLIHHKLTLDERERLGVTPEDMNF